MKIECPICKALLNHSRIDDGEIINRIGPYGEIIEIANNSNGYDKVYCSNDENHELSFDLITKVINLIN